MPMAGAPRTRSILMASHTASHVAAVDLDELDRQPRLVDQPQVPVDAADPVEGLEDIHVHGVEDMERE